MKISDIGDDICVEEYVKYLLDGDLVAIPTETVYGLGGNAFNQKSILDIYKIKGRPKNNPLICHVYSFEQAELQVFELTHKVNVVYKQLAFKFWPGPLSLIGKKKSEIIEDVALSGKVAVRCPNNGLTLKFIKMANVPIAAPSANRSGHISPTNPQHIIKEFTEQYMREIGVNIWILYDRDCCNIGVESTVIEYVEDTNEIIIYRPGAISKCDILNCLTKDNQFIKSQSWIKDINIRYFSRENRDLDLPSPGMDIKHYSPIVSTFLIKVTDNLLSSAKPINTNIQNIIIIDIGHKLEFLTSEVGVYMSLSEYEDDFKQACRNLFNSLHKAEDMALSKFPDPNKVKIFLMGFKPQDDISSALWDRLYRASNGIYVYIEISKVQNKVITQNIFYEY
ncbi:uncharacterized protein CMU_029190 [Cryptosporidium muris RN66]|uniref:Threonylcarbamoyl-AMP synthase n=1 Tax=Cryptosporidium muris (strain RN66) TaxID=441375 RepID=B6AI04_CRYMR|nr:uncharacterized protein CMU_029190 [Cryptosporidium muris RN66]EEA07845.1 hypothetical protein, conserved [Cryptosporidium muris RN66]|eukprot:XP_002142194.1 hypothetical protein [Cryptosporidium muris RN66]